MIVELRKIGKQFPGVRALHDVSLAIERGEVLGLVGENGAGKSTLIKILGGVIDDYRGEVVVGGKVQQFRSTRAARRAGICVVHQELSLVPEMSIADNLMLGREPARFGIVDLPQLEADARAIVRRVLDQPDLDHPRRSRGLGPTQHLPDSASTASLLDLATPVNQLGVGVQQLLEIAKALAEHARVIILDEPTAALSDSEIARLFAIVRERRAAGTSFIYISHRLEEIAALCDRVAVLRDGELVAIEPATTPSDKLVAAMTGKELGDVHARREKPAASTAPVLEVERLSVGHPTVRGRRVVADLSFAVRAGEVVALAGAMGSGRTATMAALFGIARAKVTGAIKVDGKLVHATTPREAIAAGFALVPEDRKALGLVLTLGVGDNLALSSLRRLSTFGVVDGPRAEQTALARLRDLSIKAPGLGAEVATLSGGNQQKVVIGKWLELAPRVLLLDEPTRGVDVGAKAEIYRLIEELTARGHAVVIASSDLPEVVRLADRVLVLREGKLAGTLAGDRITQLAIMQLAVGTSEQATGVAS